MFAFILIFVGGALVGMNINSPQYYPDEPQSQAVCVEVLRSQGWAVQDKPGFKAPRPGDKRL